jgi:serine/threonine protein kinase
MSQMCPNCSHDNPDGAQTCLNCPSPLRGLLGYKSKLGNRYEVVSVLGCGAMGAVYLAEDTRLVGRRCAIKENLPDTGNPPEVLTRMREQFLAEASVLARLDHPGLPKVSDYFIEIEREYLVMDYVEGEDLDSMLQRYQEPLPQESVLNWADQVLDALTYLHNQRPQPIIHRDIKPANLRVNLQDKVKLVDFGLVKLLDTSKPETKLELRGLGTPAYAPLEQFASSEDHTDTRTDIYALGATLYHLLTNLYPPDVHQRLLDPAVLPPPRALVPDISENTEQTILKAMAIYPGERYQSAAEMRQALAGQSKVPARRLTGRTAEVPTSLWVFGFIGLVLVLFVLGAVALFAFSRPPQNPPPPGQTVVVVVATPTELILQSLSDAPTATPTPVVETTSAPVEATTAATDETSPIATPTATLTPTTASAATSQGLSLPRSSLTGAIAYPVFNGVDFDLYLGQVDGSGTRLFRKSASQPAFSPDGARIAFHSWLLDGWGLMNTNLSGDDEKLIARFVEDQLPTWTADSQEILFLSRREGDRKSRLMKVGSAQVGSDGVVLGEGEYPTIGQNGQLVFKGWGRTGNGLRLSTTNLTNIQSVTDNDDDTAPALSPNGTQVAFMSRRDGNWEIYLVNADGSNLLRLTDDPAQDGLPTWSADGRVIAFVSSRGGTWGVWGMTPTGRGQSLLFPMEGSPDGFVGTNRDASRGWAEERISWGQVGE